MTDTAAARAAIAQGLTAAADGIKAAALALAALAPAEEPPTDGPAEPDPDPAPDPAPEPDPAPDPDPTPAPDPVPAPVPTPVPLNRKAQIIGLRDRSTPNGIKDRSRLKVVGQDPLPKGVNFDNNSVNVPSGVTAVLDGWDLGGRGLEVRGHCQAIEVASFDMKGPLAGGPLYPIEVYIGGSFEGEYLEMTGGFGHWDSPSAVANARSSGKGTSFAAGEIRRIAKSRFEGFGEDLGFKLHGVKGGLQEILDNYFGHQWAVGTGAHSDMLTTVANLGNLLIQGNLFEHLDDAKDKGGSSSGITNCLRISRNTGTDYPIGPILVTENVLLFESYYAIQVANNGLGNWNGPIDFDTNWVQAGLKGKYFHPSTNGLVRRWVNMRDALTDALIAPPAGASIV